MRAGIVVSVVVLFILCSSNSESIISKANALAEFFTKLEEANMFNGIVLVAEKGKVIFEKAIGFSDFNKKTPINLQSVFEVGSISKTFTAVAVHILSEKGMLSIDDSITKFFPKLPYEDVTLKGLLSHTSGLFDVPNDGNLRDQFRSFYNRVDVPYTNKDYLAYLEKYKPPIEIAPGEKNIYSNTGYVLLALVVEKVSGEPFQEFLRKNIFEPVGMNHTFLLSWPLLKKEERYLASGYRDDPIEGIIRETDHNPGTAIFGMSYGDDEIASTVEDMLAFDQALRNNKLLKPDTIDKMLMAPKLSNGSSSRYGQGFVVIEEEGVRTIYHGGSTAGFWAHCKFSTDDDDSTVVLFTNVKSTLVRFSAIHRAIRQILRGYSAAIPKQSIVYPLADYLKKHSVDDSQDNFSRVVESGKYRLDVDPLIHLAERYRKSGEMQKSRFILECILHIEPDNKTAKRELIVMK